MANLDLREKDVSLPLTVMKTTTSRIKTPS